MKRSIHLLLKLLPYAMLVFFIANIFYLRWPDFFLVGTAHGRVGYDFYSVPRSFINLQNHKSIFNTPFANWYGPYASDYLYHPALAISVGWLSFFKPKIAFALFVIIISALLLWIGNTWRKYFIKQHQKDVAVIFVCCSLPVYLVMWNAQMHIFTIISVVLIVTALIDIFSGINSSHKLAAGILISLLSKPIIILFIPLLILLKETRRTTVIALIIYIAVSCCFLFIPYLNPEGNNILHWKNILLQSASVERANPEIFSLSVTLSHLLKQNIHPFIFQLTILLILALSLQLLFVKDYEQRLNISLAVLLALLCSYYIAYTLVWEYHYTTIMALMPCFLILKNRLTGYNRRLLNFVLICGCLLYLPTTFFIDSTPVKFSLLLMRLCKVLPVLLMFIGLSAYLVLQAKNHLLIYKNRVQ